MSLAMGHHLKQNLEINTSVGFDFRHWKFNVFDVTENHNHNFDDE
jgi:hypothetical protein